MARSDEPEPIEVELLSSDGVDSPFRRPGTTSSTTSSTTSVGEEPRSSPRGVLVPLVVGMIALGVGWVLGRGSPDPSDGTVPAVTAASAASDPVGSIAPAPSDASTVVSTTGEPTTTPAPPQEEEPARPAVVEADVAVHPDLQGQPIEIVAYGNGRQLFQLDLATARLRSQQVTAQPFGRARVLVGPTWALLPSNDAALSSTIVWDDGRTATVDLGLSEQILGVADGRSVWWVFTAPDALAGAFVQLRSVQGDFEEVIAGMPVVPARVDPAGGVLLELPDGWFGVVPQRAVTDAESGATGLAEPTVVPITSGRLLAISAEFALVEECDDRLVCARVVIDRDTSERRVIKSAEELRGPAPYAIAGSSSIAPGGRSAVVEVLEPNDRASTQRSLGVIDLTTGEVNDIGPTQDVDQIVWTPDGRFVLFIAGGRVVAYDTESSLIAVVADELVAIDAFGVRPAGE